MKVKESIIKKLLLVHKLESALDEVLAKQEEHSKDCVACAEPANKQPA